MYEEISGGKTRNRGFYETVKGKYAPELQPTLSYLRQEQTLKNNQSSYAFDFKTANAKSTTERLISITDAVGVNQLQIGLMLREIARPSNGVILTFPSLDEVAPGFNASTVAAPSAAAKAAVRDLEAIYNGSVTLSVDNNTIFDALDTRRFREVPATQQGAFAGRNSARYEQGQVAIEPQLFLDGARSNKLIVNVPTFNGMAIEPDNAAFELVLVALASGFRVQGGAGLKR